jgi:uncharacterized delta-60 repeat protein
VVARFLTNGSPDLSFGSAGLVAEPFFGNTIIFGPLIGDLVVQADGKIVMACQGLTRLLSTGALDTSFGSTARPTPSGQPWAVALQTDGKILVVGNSAQISRYNSDGSLDTSLAVAGSASVPAVAAGSMAIAASGEVFGYRVLRHPANSRRFCARRTVHVSLHVAESAGCDTWLRRRLPRLSQGGTFAQPAPRSERRLSRTGSVRS